MKAKLPGGSFIGSQTSVLLVLGLALVVLGWIALLAGILVTDQILQAGSLVSTMTTRADIVTVAQAAIVSGLGLAIIGALRSGFGAFGRFFEAVLQRSASPRPAGSPPSAAPTVSVPPLDRDMRDDRPAPPSPPPLRSKGHNYVVLLDGSVEVETMFGTRIFATLDEAREFIR